MELRIQNGREKVDRLGERLDGVRRKVETSSVRETESRRVIGRRLRMLWGFLGFLAVLFVILAMTRQWRRNEYVAGNEVLRLVDRREDTSEESMCQGNGQQRMERRRDAEGSRSATKTGTRFTEEWVRNSSVDVDATLRLFNEL